MPAEIGSPEGEQRTFRPLKLNKAFGSFDAFKEAFAGACGNTVRLRAGPG
jgi:hypothetical protein